ncbi:MAG: GPP34 family phosphoprotein [Candidatus Krumholzibacteria bacterium]|jgi:hypothetical protein|nr:GPP34 family phosphoprotein [Candidatus Krumholzibacteria bacterium]MDP6668344.1 GPP34 family phosphoprotein [Candidatus Krumholzibacteria bacterium]MDP6796383.1 GPP34 family phosphoprotein [Candidatus Krumholzibacteria bacterium]MDP7022203.1 GPP34 family phosphoprotein [Candidatus Krumholzibacteria bacterium]
MPNLAESLLLIALDDKEGTLPSRAATALPFALPAMLLHELAILSIVTHKGNRLLVSGRKRPEDPLLLDLMTLIQSARVPRTVKYWAGKLCELMPDLQERLLDRLLEDSILRNDNGRYLKISSSEQFPLQDELGDQAIRARLRRAILEDEKPDAESLALIGMIRSCGLLGELFSRDERREAGRRAREIVEESARAKKVRKPVSDLIGLINQEVSSAILAADSSSRES